MIYYTTIIFEYYLLLNDVILEYKNLITIDSYDDYFLYIMLYSV